MKCGRALRKTAPASCDVLCGLVSGAALTNRWLHWLCRQADETFLPSTSESLPRDSECETRAVGEVPGCVFVTVYATSYCDLVRKVASADNTPKPSD